MCRSSLVPAFGLIGVTGTPASSAPMTPTAISGSFTAHAATRSLPDHLLGHRGGGVAKLPVAQLPIAEPQGDLVGRIRQRREQHARETSTGTRNYARFRRQPAPPARMRTPDVSSRRA